MPRAPISTSQSPPPGSSALLTAPGKITPHGEFLAERPTKKDPNRLHLGIDIAGPEGTAVYAPIGGQVVATWTDDATKPFSGFGPGGMLILATDGTYHLLGHLDPKKLYWQVGDDVADGALVGATSNLNHVHWEVRNQHHWNATHAPNVAYNPADWLATTAFGGPTMSVLMGDNYTDWQSAGWFPIQERRPLPGAPAFPAAPVPPPAPTRSPWLLVGLVALLLYATKER